MSGLVEKGFTLIELLAVITILSIILLIVVPIVGGIVRDSIEKTREQSVELYGRAIEDAVNTYYVKYPLENEVTLEKLKTENLIDYKGNKVECEIVQIVDRDVYLQDCKVGNKDVEYKYGVPLLTLETEDYKGYYADVDADGVVDGIIYADLAFSKGGQWSDENGTYTYNKATGELNEYKISKRTYKLNEGFGENRIIELKNSKSNSRFYVMALEDFILGSRNDNTYYWYYKIGNVDSIITDQGFGTDCYHCYAKKRTGGCGDEECEHTDSLS